MAVKREAEINKIKLCATTMQVPRGEDVWFLLILDLSKRWGLVVSVTPRLSGINLVPTE
jgi:hypothetical protein